MIIMMKTEINGEIYFTRNNPNGYGYEIMKKVLIEGTKNISYTLIFRSYNKILVVNVMDVFMSGEIVTDFPDTSTEIPPPKILVSHFKHWDGYYDVSTPKLLNNTYRHILKEVYSDNIDSYAPLTDIVNDTGVESQEELDKIPNDIALKDIVQKKWNEYQEKIKCVMNDSKSYDNLKAVVVNDEGDAQRAMQEWRKDRWEIEEVNKII